VCPSLGTRAGDSAGSYRSEIQTDPLDCELHTLIYTFALETPLPNIVVVPIKLDINIPAIYVKFGALPKYFDLLFISLISRQFTSWQGI